MTSTNRMPRPRQCAIVVALLLSVGGCDAFMSPERRVERAQKSMSAGDYRSASVDLRTALQSNGNDVHARVLMAEVAMKLGDPVTAQIELRKARALGLPQDQGVALECEVLLGLAKFDDLIQAIEGGGLKLVEPARSIALGRAHNGLKEYAKAAEYFTSALQRAPQSEQALAGLAEALGGSGEERRALTIIGQLTREKPAFAYGWLTQGRLQAQGGDFDAAAVSFRRAEQHAVGQLDAYQTATLLGLSVETSLSRGDRAEARRVQQKLAATGLNTPLAALLGARILLSERKYAAAVDLLQPLVAQVEDLVAARFLLGAALLADDRLEQAEHQLSRVVREHPEHIEARKLLAQTRLRLSRGTAAIEALMPALESDSGDPSLPGLAATANLLAGNRSAAIGILERAVTQHPEDADAQLRLARALMIDQQFERAAGVLQRMPPATRSHPQRAALLISATALQGGSAAADQTITKLLQDTHNDPGILNVAAAYYARRFEYDRAKVYLARALQLYPNDVNTELHMARVQEASGNLDIARGSLERLLAREPASVPARLELSRMWAQQGDNARAARVLEQDVSDAPKSRPLQLALMQQYFATKQTTKADQLAKRLLAAEPQSAELNHALGQLYADSGAYDQAMARFMASVAAAPENPDYQFAVARTRLALGHEEAARVMLNQLLQRRPDWTPAVATVALADLRNGRTDAALERARAHADKRPNEPASLGLLGDVQLATGRYAEAAKSYSRVASLRDSATVAVKEARARQLAGMDSIEAPLLRWLERHPGDLMVHAVLAEMYANTGRSARAVAEYELLAGQRPKDALVLNNLAWLYFEAQDERALSVAERAYRLAPNVVGIADTYGWILTQRGRAAEAVGILQKADASSDGQFAIGYHYAAALAQTGQKERARERLTALLKSTRTAPDRGAAEQLLARLDSL